jgi:hypothetical protein
MYNIVYHPELGAQPTAAGWATSQFTNNPAAIQTAGTIQNAYSTMTALSLPGVVLAQPALAATATGVAAYLSSPTNINGITNGTAQVLINNTGSPTLTNTLTAFGSGYAMGALGTRLSLGDISLIRLGTRGFFLGFTADSAAQGIELLTDRHPGDNFQVTRAIMNGLGTAFSVSAGGLAGQNPVNLTGWQEAVYKPTVEYMGFAIGKYFNMIPNYVKDENLLR